MTIYTIGHSTRSLDDFVGLLQQHGIVQLADVRTVPKSRRHPHFAGDALSKSLPGAGISYRHAPGLGGLRKPAADSNNSGWRHPSFRGYADYMQTPAFEDALNGLIQWSGERLTAVMCAEAVWWQCHRQLIADALVARGIEARHIMSAKAADVHTLTSFARVDGTRVTYPGLI
ncbi:MAG TPA: DUF488 domain-containing protein [Vicinamibacterales bacterium]|nr:DUF488 domain-containing protein [Vicinamibacterales bacterium]